MTINSIPLNVSSVFAGLGTATYNVVTAGLYTCAFVSTIPYIASGSSANSTVTTGGSALSVVINQNGSPILTSVAPSPTQPQVGGKVTFQAAVSDVITVVLTSANAVDAVPNAVKTTINLYSGE